MGRRMKTIENHTEMGGAHTQNWTKVITPSRARHHKATSHCRPDWSSRKVLLGGSTHHIYAKQCNTREKVMNTRRSKLCCALSVPIANLGFSGSEMHSSPFVSLFSLSSQPLFRLLKPSSIVHRVVSIWLTLKVPCFYFTNS